MNRKIKNSGFTLLVSIIITSMFLLVSFVVANVALKQLVISFANHESQYAFYNSDSGIECAIFWDIQRTTPSPFDPYTPTPYAPVPRCNAQNLVFVTATPPPIVDGYSTSTIQFNLPKGCARVDIVKMVGAATTTKIDSHGFNTCVAGSFRKYERGITITY